MAIVFDLSTLCDFDFKPNLSGIDLLIYLGSSDRSEVPEPNVVIVTNRPDSCFLQDFLYTHCQFEYICDALIFADDHRLKPDPIVVLDYIKQIHKKYDDSPWIWFDTDADRVSLLRTKGIFTVNLTQ